MKNGVLAQDDCNLLQALHKIDFHGPFHVHRSLDNDPFNGYYHNA